MCGISGVCLDFTAAFFAYGEFDRRTADMLDYTISIGNMRLEYK